MGFRLDEHERRILNALGANPRLTPGNVAEIVGVDDGLMWMRQLIGKLNSHRIELIVEVNVQGEPVFQLKK